MMSTFAFDSTVNVEQSGSGNKNQSEIHVGPAVKQFGECGSELGNPSLMQPRSTGPMLW